MKVEVQSPYNRIINSYNRKGHRAFAVFLLSIFVGKCRRIVSDVRCRSPPLHLDFKHFKNSDGRYLCKRIVPKAPVQMIVSREYVGTQTVTEAFIPIISEDIRKKIAEGDTFDKEGLSA